MGGPTAGLIPDVIGFSGAAVLGAAIGAFVANRNARAAMISAQGAMIAARTNNAEAPVGANDPAPEV